MKKILFVANVAKEHIMTFHLPQMRVFQEHGWQVDVACSGEAEVPFCNHQYRTSWKRSPFSFKTFKGIRELTKIIHDNQYDIVYCHTPVGGLTARLAARKARKNGTKVIYFAHGLHFFKGAPLLNWLLYYPVEKWLARYTDVFFTLNEEDHNFVQSHFRKEMIKTLTPGVGVNFTRLQVENKEAVRQEYRKQLGLAEDAPLMIYVAEINKNKNQQFLVEATKHLLTDFPNCRLILVGPQNDDGLLQTYIQEQGLQETISLLGWRSDIGQLMCAADLCVASSMREGLSINLLEALYCNLPVVATDNRGHRAVIRDGENGFLVPLNDPRAMANRIKDLLTDDALYAHMSHIDVDHYECNHVAKVLYNEIIQYAQ